MKASKIKNGRTQISNTVYNFSSWDIPEKRKKTKITTDLTIRVSIVLISKVTFYDLFLFSFFIDLPMNRKIDNKITILPSRTISAVGLLAVNPAHRARHVQY